MDDNYVSVGSPNINTTPTTPPPEYIGGHTPPEIRTIRISGPPSGTPATAGTPRVSTPMSLDRLRFTNRTNSKRRRTYFSMVLSGGIFCLSAYILIWSKEEQLRLVSISLLSSISSVWLSNIKVSSKNNDDDSI